MYFQERFITLYEGIKIDRRVKLLQQQFYLLKRLMFGIIIVMMEDYGGFQISMLVIITMTHLGYYLHAWPYEEPLTNKMEVANDISTLCILYTMYGFFDNVYHLSVFMSIGYFLLSILLLNFTLHFYILISEMV